MIPLDTTKHPRPRAPLPAAAGSGTTPAAPAALMLTAPRATPTKNPHNRKRGPPARCHRPRPHTTPRVGATHNATPASFPVTAARNPSECCILERDHLVPPRGRQWHKPRTPNRASSGSGHPIAFTLAALVVLALHATAQVAPSVTYAAAPDVQFPTTQGTLQGVALHADEVLTQSTTRLAAYQDGQLVRVRDTTQDGSFGAHNGDGAVLGNRLFISTSNFPTPLHERSAAVSIYDASSFAYIGEWKPQGTKTGAGGGLGTGIEDGSLWWPFAHKPCETCPVEQVIHELDPQTGAIQRTFPLNSSRDLYAYQTCDWLPGNLLLCPMHGGQGVDYSDLYHFDGAAFHHAAEVPHFSWSSTNQEKVREYGSQGFAVQVDEDGTAWTWWAGRDAQGNGAGSGDVVRVATATTSPTPPPAPDPDPPGDDPPPNDDVPGGGGITTAAATAYSALGALATAAVLVLVASRSPTLRFHVQRQPVTFALGLTASLAVVYGALAWSLATAPLPA